MQELIRVSQENGRVTLLARDLYEFLEVGTDFRHWFPRMKEYGFAEETDYTPVIFDHPLNGQPTVDYQLTIEMAKEICMLQRTEKGKIARQYFIQIEKEWNSPYKLMARALEFAHEELCELKFENKKMYPKALFADAVATSSDCILIGELSKLIKQNGFEIGQNRLFQWMREKNFLISRWSDYNMPTQKSMEMGLMEIKERTVNNPDGSVRTTRTTKITGRGQIYFVNKFICKKTDSA